MKYGQSGGYGGKKRTPTYISWHRAHRRCTAKPGTKHYRNYASKGIRVCARWSGTDGFANFLADMGPRPAGTTIHRLKNELGYEPGNCVWATAEVQGREKSTTKLSMEQAQEIRGLVGEGARQKDVAQRLNVSANAVYSVVYNKTWKDATYTYTPKPKPSPRLIEKVPQDPVLRHAKRVECGRRAVQSPKYLAHMEALRQDPEYRAKQVEWGRRAVTSPGYLAHLERLNQDPEYRVRQVALGRLHGRAAEAKLDAEKVIEIRKLASQGEPKKALARKFGVSPLTIRKAVNNLTWRDVAWLKEAA